MARNTEDLISSLADDLKPVAPLRPRAGLIRAAVAMTVGVLGLTSILQVRPDLLALQPAPLPLVAMGLFLVLALSTAWTVLDMARPSVGVRREGWLWTALMAAVLPVGAGLMLAEAVLHGHPAHVDDAGLTCLTAGVATGLLTAVTLTLRVRRGAPTSATRAAWLIGVAAGAAGIFAVSFCCPDNGLIHIGVWHGGTVILTAVAGRLILPRLLTW